MCPATSHLSEGSPKLWLLHQVARPLKQFLPVQAQFLIQATFVKGSVASEETWLTYRL